KLLEPLSLDALERAEIPEAGYLHVKARLERNVFQKLKISAEEDEKNFYALITSYFLMRRKTGWGKLFSKNDFLSLVIKSVKTMQSYSETGPHPSLLGRALRVSHVFTQSEIKRLILSLDHRLIVSYKLKPIVNSLREYFKYNVLD